MAVIEVRIGIAPKCRCWNPMRDGHQLDCHSILAQGDRMSRALRAFLAGPRPPMVVLPSRSGEEWATGETTGRARGFRPPPQSEAYWDTARDAEGDPS